MYLDVTCCIVANGAWSRFFLQNSFLVKGFAQDQDLAFATAKQSENIPFKPKLHKHRRQWKAKGIMLCVSFLVLLIDQLIYSCIFPLMPPLLGHCTPIESRTPSAEVLSIEKIHEQNVKILLLLKHHLCIF